MKDGHPGARTLLDLSQTAAINDSLAVGKAVLGELGNINRLHKGEVEQASFAVLKAPDIPSILVGDGLHLESGKSPPERRGHHQGAWPKPSSAACGVTARNPPMAKSKLARLELKPRRPQGQRMQTLRTCPSR